RCSLQMRAISPGSLNSLHSIGKSDHFSFGSHEKIKRPNSSPNRFPSSGLRAERNLFASSPNSSSFAAAAIKSSSIYLLTIATHFLDRKKLFVGPRGGRGRASRIGRRGRRRFFRRIWRG